MIDNTKLMKLRVSKGITQYKLAKETGIAPSIINKIESGKNKNPSFNTMMDLCKYLDVSVLSILK